MRTLLEARIDFTRCLGQLLLHGNEQGMQLIACEVLRSPQAATWNAEHCAVHVDGVRCERTLAHSVHAESGHRFSPIGVGKSVHLSGLAVDLYVIVLRKISNEEAPYANLARYWKTLDPIARWGGDFKSKDLGHYSFEWEGRK
jgi:hypothetical protein